MIHLHARICPMLKPQPHHVLPTGVRVGESWRERAPNAVAEGGGAVEEGGAVAFAAVFAVAFAVVCGRRVCWERGLVLG